MFKTKILSKKYVDCRKCPIDRYCRELVQAVSLKDYQDGCFLLGNIFDELVEILGMDTAFELMKSVSRNLETELRDKEVTQRLMAKGSKASKR